MPKLEAVQIRLMGDHAAVNQVAAQMVEAGLIAITGSTPNRQGDGIRVYGVAVPTASAPIPLTSEPISTGSLKDKYWEFGLGKDIPGVYIDPKTNRKAKRKADTARAQLEAPKS